MADTLVHRGFTEAKEKGTLHPTVKNLYNANNLSIVLVDELEKAPRSIATAFL